GFHNPIGAFRRKAEYTYDESNLLLSSFVEHYRDGSFTYQETKAYDDGRLINQEYKYPSDDSLGYNIEYMYDEDGNLIKETWSGREARVLEYRYENGLLVEICTVAGYSNASTIYYTYDESGNLLSQLDVGQNDSSHVLFEYTYDEDGNVLTKSESMDIGKYSITKDWENVYVYNNGQLIEMYEYFYDGSEEEIITSSYITEYTYEDGKLLREVKYSYRSDGTLYDNGVNYTEYTYDENGNLIASVYLDSERAELYKYEYTYVAFSVND
ncbi:MAG: hypothetical protein LUI10_12305, partial [Lachnospiraceae bacterium]|nr:hypothetical protein [Lachnospiraceae bacterium]